MSALPYQFDISLTRKGGAFLVCFEDVELALLEDGFIEKMRSNLLHKVAQRYHRKIREKIAKER